MHTGCCIFMIVYHESWVVPARLTVAVGAKICFIIDSYTSWGGQTVQESIILLRGKGWGVVWGYRFRLGPRHELGTSVGHFVSLLCRRGRHCCHPHPPHWQQWRGGWGGCRWQRNWWRLRWPRMMRRPEASNWIAQLKCPESGISVGHCGSCVVAMVILICLVILMLLILIHPPHPPSSRLSILLNVLLIFLLIFLTVTTREVYTNGSSSLCLCFCKALPYIFKLLIVLLSLCFPPSFRPPHHSSIVG